MQTLESQDPGARRPFVGRRRELAGIQAGIAGLAEGRGSLFLLAGEPGIGKTRLAEEAARFAASAGVRVVWGRCHEDEGRPPYWPWAQVVRSAALSPRGGGALDQDVLDYARDAAASPIVELIPELRLWRNPAAAAAAADGDGARFRLFQALTALLRRLSAGQPLLLVLDDVHWADLPSLLLLEFLAHELPDSPIAVIATFREVEVRRAPLVADLLGRLGRRGSRHSLGGLDLEEVSRFVESATGRAVAATVVSWLHAQTEGNPFFLDEVVRLHRGEAQWFESRPSSPVVSDGVQAAIRQRLAPLPAETLRVLAAAAVAGREFDLPLVAAVLGEGRAEVARLLEAALALELLHGVAEKPGRFRFRHALVRETVYEQLAPGARAERHRAFAEILEARHAEALELHLPELAHHFYEAAMHGDDAKAIDYAQRAGRQALRLLAYEEAVQQFERALHLVEVGARPDPRLSCELLLDLGEARNRAGQGDVASRVLHRAAALARTIRAPELLARAATGLCEIGTVWAELGRCDETLVGILEEALDALPAAEHGLRARVIARLATERFWSIPAEESDRASAEAVALARRSGDPYGLACTLLARINCLSHADEAAARAPMIDEILELTGRRGELAANALLWRLGDALHADRTLDVPACREALVRVVQELRQPGGLWLVHTVKAQQALIEGRFEEVERAAAAMLEQPRLEPNVEQAATAALFLVRREQGRHVELAMAIEGFASQYPAVSAWRASLGMLWSDAGERERALATLDAMIEGFDALCRDSAWLFSVCCLAEIAGVFGDASHAAFLESKLEPYAGRNAMAGPMYYLAPVDYYLGLLAARRGDAAGAASRLDTALAQARRLGARPAAARILLARARIAASMEDAALGARLHREAVEIAQSVGMDAVLAAAAELDAVLGRTTGEAAAHSAAFDVAASLPARVAGAGTQVPSANPAVAVLALGHDDVRFEYRGRSIRVRAVRGFQHLARLLAEPGRDFHVLDLASSSPGEAAALDGDLGPALDAVAKARFAERVEDLRALVEEAEANHDEGRAEVARAELEGIAAELASAVGLGGRDRVRGAAAEKARAAVTKALRAAIARVGGADPELADLLERSVRTGVYCRYEPIDALALTWEVSGLEARATAATKRR